MEWSEILKFLVSLVPGIISTLIILPITSDGIRNKLFGAKGRSLVEAKQELLRVVQEMFLSGQQIDDFTYKKLVESISKQFHINSEILGSKDDTIAQILQMINTSEAIPREYKKLLSNSLKKQFDKDEDDPYSNSNIGESEDDFFEGRYIEQVLRIWREDIEQHPNYQYEYSIRLGRRYVFISIMVSLFVGMLVTFVAYMSQNATSIHIIICFLAFVLCINILVSLIDSKTSKNIDFFRRLVYKILGLMALMMLLVISVVI